MKKNEQLNDKVYVIFVDLFMLLLATYVLHGDFTEHVYNKLSLNPTTEQAGTPPPGKSVVLKIFPDGKLMLGDRETPLSGLEVSIRSREEKSVVVAVDRKTTWENLGQILLHLNKSGKKSYFAYEKKI